MLDRPTAVIGLGYVGLPLAVGLGRAGNHVIGFDRDMSVVARLAGGHSHIADVPDDELAEAQTHGLRFTAAPDDLREACQFIICVPTPLARSGYPDLSFVEGAARTIAAALKPGDVVVLESTTYPGTTEELVLPILEEISGFAVGTDIHLAFSPERIDPGNRAFNITNTPKVVGGFAACCLEAAAVVYGELGVPIVRAKGLGEAELSKLLENTYRHINIALVNEMVKFCHSLGIDLYDAIRCASTKPFGFEAFYPGPGVGGHCIPIDPNYLSYRVRAELGYSFRFVELAQEINASMPSYVVHRVQEELNHMGLPLHGSKVLVAGVTYKQDVADVRESPAVPLVEILLARGVEVSYIDPFVDEWEVANRAIPRRHGDDRTSADIDCVIVLQHHAAFVDIDFTSIAPLVLDTRGKLVGDGVRVL